MRLTIKMKIMIQEQTPNMETPVIYLTASQLHQMVVEATIEGYNLAILRTNEAKFAIIDKEEVLRRLGISSVCFSQKFSAGAYGEDIVRVSRGSYKVNVTKYPERL